MAVTRAAIVRDCPSPASFAFRNSLSLSPGCGFLPRGDGEASARYMAAAPL